MKTQYGQASACQSSATGIVEAGADFIQIDEPNYAMYRGALRELARVFNRVVEGVRAKIALHVCFGNLHGRPFPAVQGYRHLFPTLHEVHAEQILLEFANRGMEDAGLWQEFPTDKELGAGIIDVKSFKSETAEDVSARIRLLLQHVRPEQLWLNPDCGFWETPRWSPSRSSAPWSKAPASRGGRSRGRRGRLTQLRPCTQDMIRLR